MRTSVHSRGGRRGRLLRLVVALLAAWLLVGCVQPPAPEPAVLRDGPPPWDAPRDAISYIQLAGLPELPLDDRTDPWVVQVRISIDGQPVEIPAHVGVDRPRAVQAPVHTHDTSGQVWLEGRGNRQVSLADFFAVWGVRMSPQCLGGACGVITVKADGVVVEPPVGELVLWGVRELEVLVTS